MKRIFAFVCALFLGAQLHAQETLINGSVDLGGFGAPVVELTSINGEPGVIMGAEGGVIIGHTIVLGAAGYGLANNVTDPAAPSGTPYVNLGYGGVYLQYTHASDNLIHATAGILIGGGGVGYRRNVYNDVEDPVISRDTLNDAFFLVEPSVEAELNVTKWLRVGLGGSYRFISGVETQGLANSDIAGPSLRLACKFGSF